MNNQFKTLQELFADPKRWTQGTFARNENGNVVDDARSESAACFCILGGVLKVYPNEDFDWVKRALFNALERSYAVMSEWNDAPGRTIEEIQELCRKANV